MADCCDTNSCSGENPRKRQCPADGSQCSEVSVFTMRHHLKSPWQRPLPEQRYYFCGSPLCDVVYFGEDNSVFTIEEVRGPIGQKQAGREESLGDRIICYCFGITQGDAEIDPAAKVFVIQQTSEGGCACETRNPSGRCCLKDFP